MTSLTAGESVAEATTKGEMMAATRDDAMLMVELSKLAAMSDLDEASREIWSDDFDPDTAEALKPYSKRDLRVSTQGRVSFWPASCLTTNRPGTIKQPRTLATNAEF